MLGQVGEEVGAHAEHEGDAPRVEGDAEEDLDEPAALRVVGAEREGLLELVDHQQQPGLRRPAQGDGQGVRIPGQVVAQRHRVAAGRLRHHVGQRVQRVFARRHEQPPCGRPLTVPVRHGPQQAGAQQRRLAASRRAEHADHGQPA